MIDIVRYEIECDEMVRCTVSDRDFDYISRAKYPHGSPVFRKAEEGDATLMHRGEWKPFENWNWPEPAVGKLALAAFLEAAERGDNPIRLDQIVWDHSTIYRASHPERPV